MALGRVVEAGPGGAPRRMFGVNMDITEARAAEAALRESEDHHRHAVELSPQIPWTAAPDGAIRDFSPPGRR